MDDIYNSRILEFAGNIPRSGRLDPADAEAAAHSRLCGSKVRIFLRMQDGHVTDFSHEVKACALGQASSSIMARNVVGASADEIRAAREAMLAMLKADGEGPDGRFADMRILKPVKDYKARHASTMLTFDAVVDAISKVESATREPSVQTQAAG
jgi:NifU-like protein involved in Fe-S cluster formation